MLDDMCRQAKSAEMIPHYLNTLPALQVGTVEEFMFKEGVRDILEKLDSDLVGLIPVKLRVRQIAALLVLDKVRWSLLQTLVLQGGAPLGFVR